MNIKENFIKEFGESFYKLLTKEKREKKRIIDEVFANYQNNHNDQKCKTESLLKALSFILFDIKNVSVISYLDKEKFLKFLRMLCGFFETNKNNNIIENKLHLVNNVTELNLEEVKKLRTRMKANKETFPGIYNVVNVIYNALTEQNIILINKISKTLNDKKLDCDKISILPEKLIKFLKYPVFINILYLMPIDFLNQKIKK